MSKQLNKIVNVLAVCVGILAFLLARFWLTEYPSLLVAIVFGVIAKLLVPYILEADDRLYGDIDKIPDEPLRMREPVGIRIGKKFEAGYILITDNKLYLFSRSKRHSVEFTIDKSDVVDMKRVGASGLNITRGDGSLCELGSRRIEFIHKQLTDCGYAQNTDQ